MNDHEDPRKETLSRLVERTRASRRPSVLANRPSVHDSIQNARSTLIINLVIEIASGLILLAGICYTAMFMIDRRDALTPGTLHLYLSILAFFAVGWFTYIGFRVRAKYRALKQYRK